ncbi:MAG: FHA domain-containing protein [Myxococcota bacterium]|nr:FHA domain-containing protein [Myxococcota bacterium]
MIKLRGVEAGSEWALMVTRETAHLSGSEFIVDGQCERSARLALDSDVVLGSIVLRLQSVGCSTETQSITLPEGVFGAGGSVAVLTSASEGYPGGECRLVAGQELLIGQSADANLVLADDMVSPLHARMSAASDGIWLEDLGSTHGSFVKGEAVMGRVRLTDGNPILIGNVVLRLRVSRGQLPDPLQVPRGFEDLVATGAQRPLAECCVPAGLQPLLRFISGQYRGREYRIQSETTSIGRSSDSALVLDEVYVSRNHAFIRYNTWRILWIRDVSTHGTFVNGAKISRFYLKEGDRVLIGSTLMVLVWARPVEQKSACLEKSASFDRLPSHDGVPGTEMAPIRYITSQVGLPDFYNSMEPLREAAVSSSTPDSPKDASSCGKVASTLPSSTGRAS